MKSVNPTRAYATPASALIDLLGCLQRSLERSQDALLEHDLERLELCRLEQLQMSSELMNRFRDAKTPLHTDHCGQLSRNLSTEVILAAKQVLQLGRVQAALLNRAQSSLYALSKMLAGLESPYGGATLRARTGIR